MIRKSWLVMACGSACLTLCGCLFGQTAHTSLVFSDSGQDLILAAVTDSAGFIYIAGSTTSGDFPVQGAFQGQIGSHQLMRSNDRGATWVKLANPPGSAGGSLIVPHPTLPQTLFAAGSKISRSTDGGATWQVVFTPMRSSTFTSVPAVVGRVAISSPNPSMMIADTSGGLVSSADGGNTWLSLGCLFPGCGSSGDVMVADPFNAEGLAVEFSAGQGPYVSADWGRSFTSIRPGICCGSATVAYDPFHKGWIYVAYNLGTEGNLFLSTDNGKTFVQKNAPSSSFSGIQMLAADPDLPNVLYAVSIVAQLFVSTDAGDSWNPLGGAVYPTVVSALTRVCGPGGGLLTNSGFSPDFGKTWLGLPFAEVVGVATGPGCALYAARNMTTDAFVAKLSPDGRQIMWATYFRGE